MDAIAAWAREHVALLSWLSGVSVLMFIGSLIAIPWLIVRMPADYFVRRRHYVDRWRGTHPAWRFLALTAKNICGTVLVVMGIVMLFLPGQGVLAIVVGLTLLDFPGKFALEQRIARSVAVLHALNWVRTRAHQPPLESAASAGARPTGSE